MDRFWFYTARILAVAAVLAGAVLLVVLAGPLLEALTIAALLAYLLAPAVRLLTRWTRLNRPLAVGIVYLMFLLILAGIPAGLGAIAVNQFHYLEYELLEAIAELENWLAQPIVLLGFSFYPRLLLENLEQVGGNLFETVSERSFHILSGVTTNLLWGSVILVSLYYLLKDGPKIKPWLVGLAPARYQDDTRFLLDEIDEVWSLFLRVQLFIFLVLTILMALGTLLVIWLFRAGLVPFSLVGLVLMLILVYTLVQQVDNLWLRPQLMGRKLHLHPGLVFVGLITALALSGVLGALIVVPAMATVKVLGSYLHHKLVKLPAEQPSAIVHSDPEKAVTPLTEEPESTISL
ncbi:MAG: AI-2E family transporter [Anaerolineae bacterium]|nr:AI-2E family transporter [Anaerolineae bacterium]